MMVGGPAHAGGPARAYDYANVDVGSSFVPMLTHKLMLMIMAAGGLANAGGPAYASVYANACVGSVFIL
eukprot:10221896-Alexandrium_andersonii.AAC.1